MKEAIFAVVASQLSTSYQKQLYDVLTTCSSLGEAFDALESIKDLRQKLDEAEKVIDAALKDNIRPIAVSSCSYPILVKEIYEPPFVLWVKATAETRFLRSDNGGHCRREKLHDLWK